MKRLILLVVIPVAILGSSAHTRTYFPADGCPSPAIGSVSFPPDNDYSVSSGTYVDQNLQSEHGILTVHFWRRKPQARAVIVVDLDSRKAHATLGSVKRFGKTLCAFSV